MSDEPMRQLIDAGDDASGPALSRQAPLSGASAAGKPLEDTALETVVGGSRGTPDGLSRVLDMYMDARAPMKHR